MTRAIECEGAPRDLGRDQGRACAEALRERFGSLARGARLRLRLGALGPSARALRRELARHFPRQAEALAGMSAAAGVPAAWLAECLEREVAGSGEEIALAAGGEVSRADAFVARALPGEWIVRRSRPEGGFRSIEVTCPWLAPPLLGVNEAGLAVAVVAPDPAPLALAELHGSSGPLRGRARGAALPAALLALDCLQRFATLGACLEWCAGRPGERPAALLFTDPGGELAGIEIAPGLRRILRPAEGWLAVGGSPAAREALGKELRESGGLAGELPSPFTGPLAVAYSATRSLRIGPESHEA